MTQKTFSTGNSKTELSFNDDWLVLDVGSGHNPHPRANILVDRFFEDDLERSGQSVSLPENVPFIIADASALPFKDKTFDFVIYSHVAEHIEPDSVDSFCAEMNRVAKAGYVESPSKIAEHIRHSQVHRWIVSDDNGTLIFTPIKSHNLLGWFGKLMRSLMFYKTSHAEGGYQDVYGFSRGVPKPFHYFFVLTRAIIARLWRLNKSIIYTRFKWKDSFDWRIQS